VNKDVEWDDEQRRTLDWWTLTFQEIWLVLYVRRQVIHNLDLVSAYLKLCHFKNLIFLTLSLPWGDWRCLYLSVCLLSWLWSRLSKQRLELTWEYVMSEGRDFQGNHDTSFSPLNFNFDSQLAIDSWDLYWAINFSLSPKGTKISMSIFESPRSNCILSNSTNGFRLSRRARIRKPK